MGRVVDASGTPVKIYPAPAREPQNALLFLLLRRDFIFKMILIPHESHGIPLDFNAPAPVQHSIPDP